MKNLRKRRTMVGWTQRQLSKKCGIERTKLSLFENGHLKPSPAETEAIERALSAAIKEHVAALESVQGPVEAA